MADPVIPGGIRAQLIGFGKSNLPEDRFVTTWAFQTASGSVEGAHHQAVRAMLDNFINAPGSGGNPVGGLFGAQMVHGVDALELRTYDLGQPPGVVGVTPDRIPTIQRIDLTASPGSTPFPDEVAICASFRGAANQPRTRGRVFIGPLSASAATFNIEANSRVRVAPAAMLVLCDAMDRLASYPTPANPRWCILSQASATMVPVLGGWVDDAFDTQRRRGQAAANRTTWANS